MIRASDFISSAAERGVDFWTGVPCSILAHFIEGLSADPRVDYVAATSEGEAVGIAAGSCMAGRGAAVACQNSGLGNAINPLTSLCFPFEIPVLLVVTHRGEPGAKDEPQHEHMGRITCRLLDAVEIPWEEFPVEEGDVAGALDRALGRMESTGRPYALIMKKGSVSGVERGLRTPGGTRRTSISASGCFGADPSDWMSRKAAVEIVSDTLGEGFAIVATTGKIGRELFELGHRSSRFYVVGSMGCASGIALGLRLGGSRSPSHPVAVVDGDGSALMKMGTIATIGHARPHNFVHVVLDNEEYESTGGQRTISSTVDFAEIAAACGYARCFRVDDPSHLAECLREAREGPSPSMLHVKVSGGSDRDLKRPDIPPPAIKSAFVEWWRG